MSKNAEKEPIWNLPPVFGDLGLDLGPRELCSSATLKRF